MPRIDFDGLPDHGRAWVFPATRALSPDEEVALLAEVDAFLGSWAAHGAPLLSGRTLEAGHFLVVAVDEDASQPSGCSIDALVNRLESLAAAMGIGLVEHGPVWYRKDGQIRVASREESRALAKAGEVAPDTPVFDTTLTRVGDVRARGLERPARESWHGRAFFREGRGG